MQAVNDRRTDEFLILHIQLQDLIAAVHHVAGPLEDSHQPRLHGARKGLLELPKSKAGARL